MRNEICDNAFPLYILKPIHRINSNVILKFVENIVGLDCSKCTHVTIKDVPTILQNIVLPKSPLCASTPAGQTASGVGLVRCPANPPSGQVYKCGTYTGIVTVGVDIVLTTGKLM